MSLGVHVSSGASQILVVNILTASCDANGAFVMGILFEFGVVGMLFHASAPSGLMHSDFFGVFVLSIGAVCIGMFRLVFL